MAASAIIINADDLGLWPPVDSGIFAAWEAGAISDCTAFASSPRLPELLKRACDVGMPVGVHLNLTYGAPLCDPAKIPALAGPDGLLMKRAMWRLPLPEEQIRRELSRQIARWDELGFTPSHLDSHHHVHSYPEVFSVVMEIAKARGLPVRAMDAGMRDTLRAAGIATTDAFSMAFYGDNATTENLCELAEGAEGVLEIMTHPGGFAADIPSSYAREREQELQALQDPEWRAFLRERDIRLIGFGDLSQRSKG